MEEADAMVYTYIRIYSMSGTKKNPSSVHDRLGLMLEIQIIFGTVVHSYNDEWL